MDTYELKVKYAKELLDIALEYNELLRYLAGAPDYDINMHDLNGNKTFPVGIIMEAIYDKYKNAPESKVDVKLYEALEEGFGTTKNGKTLLYLLEEIEYQLKSEKNNTAPFKMDCSTLLKNLSDNIKENIEFYSEKVVTEDYILENGFIEPFKYHDEILEKNYGYKLL